MLAERRVYGGLLASEGVARTASRTDFVLYKAWYGAGTI